MLSSRQMLRQTVSRSTTIRPLLLYASGSLLSPLYLDQNCPRRHNASATWVDNRRANAPSTGFFAEPALKSRPSIALGRRLLLHNSSQACSAAICFSKLPLTKRCLFAPQIGSEAPKTTELCWWCVHMCIIIRFMRRSRKSRSSHQLIEAKRT